MEYRSIKACYRQIMIRQLEEGGFSALPGGRFRTDATAWAIMALKDEHTYRDSIEKARNRLAFEQFEDGRVCISKDLPETIWPTALAILAWHGSPAHKEPLSKAVRFLIRTSGKHWEKTLSSPVGHDPSIRGWPWIDNTHSWVEPTAVSLIALKATGFKSHRRSMEAVRLLMDRQLLRGGWNYGNTTVFGQQLRPMPETTGGALTALSGLVDRDAVEKSLIYLKSRAMNLRTPIALGWSILALGSWDNPLKDARKWILETIARQARIGPFDTSSLGLLSVAFSEKKRFINIVQQSKDVIS